MVFKRLVNLPSSVIAGTRPPLKQWAWASPLLMCVLSSPGPLAFPGSGPSKALMSLIQL